MSDTVNTVNPLLSIDTGFRSYLNAYTRSFQNHIIDGQLDYAYDSDFAVRQKMIGLSGWGKLTKAINTNDIPNEARMLFLSCEQAGSLKYPEIFDILKQCCERLELNLPAALIRNDIERPLIYSISSDLLEPSIVITKSLITNYSHEELEFLIGSECGRLQNNHCLYSRMFSYLNVNENVFKPVGQSFKGTVSASVARALIDWINYADITAARAGMICMDAPGRFIEVVCSLFNKGYIDFYGRGQTGLDAAALEAKVNDNHTVAVRGLKAANLSAIENYIAAAAEFLNCDSLFKWRKDLIAADVHTCTGQVCDVRTNIILSGGGSK